MKTAICLSGLMTDLENSLEVINETFIKHLNPDIFICTCIKNKEEKEQYLKIISKYFKAKIIVLYNYNEHIDNVIENVTKKISTNNYKNAPQLRLFSQFNLLYNCNELKKSYEKENNFTYDLVIRMRTELYYIRKIYDEEIEMTKKGFLCIQSAPEWGGLQHAYFYSNSEVMDKACSNWATYSCFKKYGIGKLIDKPGLLMSPANVNHFDKKILNYSERKDCLVFNAEFLFLIHIRELGGIKIYRTPINNLPNRIRFMDFNDKKFLDYITMEKYYSKLTATECLKNVIEDYDNPPSHFNRYTPVDLSCIHAHMIQPFKEKSIKGFGERGYKVDRKLSWKENLINYLNGVHKLNIKDIMFEENEKEVEVYIPFNGYKINKLKTIKILYN
jgi:hypothetical protein